MKNKWQHRQQRYPGSPHLDQIRLNGKTGGRVVSLGATRQGELPQPREAVRVTLSGKPHFSPQICSLQRSPL